MAAVTVKTLAHPVDDKRKASVQSTTITTLVGVSNSDECIDVRGFANFTVSFPVAISTGVGTTAVAVAIHVAHDTDSASFIPLFSPGVSGAAVSLASGAVAYDVPELAGCHYVRFQAGAVSVADNRAEHTIRIMGKV